MKWIVEAETLEDMLNDNYNIVTLLTRCKDCKYYGYHECFHGRGLTVAFDNTFCSYAERR